MEIIEAMIWKEQKQEPSRVTNESPSESPSVQTDSPLNIPGATNWLQPDGSHVWLTATEGKTLRAETALGDSVHMWIQNHCCYELLNAYVWIEGLCVTDASFTCE